MNIFEINKGYFKVFDGKTAYNLYVDEHRNFNHLHDPDDIYNRAVKAGLDEGQIIDLMLRFLHRRRLIKGDYLGEYPLCVTLIGPRGSGKSVGLTGIAVLDGLLAGRQVVSNMPIRIKVRYRDAEKIMESEELMPEMLLDVNDFLNNYYDCLICIDEVNKFMADSARSTMNQALYFSYDLQEMRKRKIDFILTTQVEGWQTDRTRSQVDFYIRCRDYAFLSGKPKKEDLGRKSRWEIFDMSGLITGEVMHADRRTWAVPPYTEKIFWNVPFWNCYDSELLQTRKKYNLSDRKSTLEFDEEKLSSIENTYQVPFQVITRLMGVNVERVSKVQLWDILKITEDHGMQSRIGRVLNELGCKTVNKKDYLIPPQAEMIKNLAKLGFEVTMEDENSGE